MTFSLAWRGQEVLARRMAQIQRALTIAGVMMERDIKQRMTASHGGETYRSRGGRASHVASAPGDAPAVDIGELRRAVGYSIMRRPSEVVLKMGIKRGGGATAGGFPLEARASALEFGTDDGHIAARPSFGPAWAAEKPNLIRRMFGGRR